MESCNSATYSEDISEEIYTLVYFSSKVILLIIKSHNKYQSRILIGLAHSEKASFEIGLFLSILDCSVCHLKLLIRVCNDTGWRNYLILLRKIRYYRSHDFGSFTVVAGIEK